jgi:hypothetical protein
VGVAAEGIAQHGTVQAFCRDARMHQFEGTVDHSMKQRCIDVQPHAYAVRVF